MRLYTSLLLKQRQTYRNVASIRQNTHAVFWGFVFFFWNLWSIWDWWTMWCDTMGSEHFGVCFAVIAGRKSTGRMLGSSCGSPSLVLRFHSPLFFFYIFVLLFWAALKACVSSQARGPVGAVAASLHHSHNNMGSKLHLRPIPQLTAIRTLNPLSRARDRTCVLMYTSPLHYHWAKPLCTSEYSCSYHYIYWRNYSKNCSIYSF